MREYVQPSFVSGAWFSIEFSARYNGKWVSYTATLNSSNSFSWEYTFPDESLLDKSSMSVTETGWSNGYEHVSVNLNSNVFYVVNKEVSGDPTPTSPTSTTPLQPKPTDQEEYVYPTDKPPAPPISTPPEETPPSVNIVPPADPTPPIISFNQKDST